MQNARLGGQANFFFNEKGGPALGPAFRTGTVIADVSAAEAELGDSSPR
jgi:hypothetical protein